MAGLRHADDPRAVRHGVVDDDDVIEDTDAVVPVLPHIDDAVFRGLGLQREGCALVRFGKFGDLVARVQNHDIGKTDAGTVGDAAHLVDQIGINGLDDRRVAERVVANLLPGHRAGLGKKGTIVSQSVPDLIGRLPAVVKTHPVRRAGFNVDDRKMSHDELLLFRE